MKIGAIALNTFRESIRNKILYSVVLFAVLLVGISAFFGAVTLGDQKKVIKDFGLFSLSFFGAILTILLGVSLLNKELKQKTIFNILSKPVSRWEFLVGKHLGLTTTVSLLVALMGTGLVLFLALLEGKVDWLLFQGILFAILEVIVIASVTIFFSSLVVTTTLTGMFTLATYISGRSISYLQFFMEGENAGPVVKPLIKIFDMILPDLSLLNFTNSIVYGTPATSKELLSGVLYTFSYSLILLVLATLIFQRRELT